MEGANAIGVIGPATSPGSVLCRMMVRGPAAPVEAAEGDAEVVDGAASEVDSVRSATNAIGLAISQGTARKPRIVVIVVTALVISPKIVNKVS